jgi:hypothetical protein
MLRGNHLPDVLDRGDGLAWGIVDRLSTGVNAREISGVRNGFGPGEKVGRLICIEVFGEKCSRCAAATAAAASFAPSVAGGVPVRFAFLTSASVFPFANTRKPKPLRSKISRLPIHELWRSPGGLVSQYPAKAKCRRSAGRAASPG